MKPKWHRKCVPPGKNIVQLVPVRHKVWILGHHQRSYVSALQARNSVMKSEQDFGSLNSIFPTKFQSCAQWCIIILNKLLGWRRGEGQASWCPHKIICWKTSCLSRSRRKCWNAWRHSKPVRIYLVVQRWGIPSITIVTIAPTSWSPGYEQKMLLFMFPGNPRVCLMPGHCGSEMGDLGVRIAHEVQVFWSIPSENKSAASTGRSRLIRMRTIWISRQFKVR